MAKIERHEYDRGSLRRADLPAEPLDLFARWLQDAVDAGILEPNAMCLATAGADGMPDARMVLLKAFQGDAFVFSTNYRSAKGMQLQDNAFAAIVFYWPECERQVRARGRVTRTSDEESDAIFAARPLGSRRAAIASPQSQVIRDRAELEASYAAAPQDAGRPAHWGGYRLVADQIEFWQGGRDRLHDRLRYRREGDRWTIERLAP